MANLYDEKILGTKQKIALAQKLRESGQDMLQGQMIGDRYVAPSWTQHLAQGLQQGLGIYGEMKGEQELKNIEREKAQATARALNQMGMAAPEDVLKSAEVPAQSPSVFNRIGAFVTGEDQPKGVPAQPYQQAIAQNLTPAQSDAALLNLMNASPELGAGAIGLSNTRATREATAAEHAYRHQKDIIEQDWKEKSFNQQQQFQAHQKEADRALKESMAQIAQSNRQGPQGSIVEVIDPNDPTRMIKMNTLTREVYGTSGSIPKVAAVAPEVSDANAAKGMQSYLNTKYLSRDKEGNITDDKVAKLIDESTSGGAQKNAADLYEWATGKGTPGAEKIAQLATVTNDITLNLLKGKLGSGISNADREFLQARSGDIANPKLASNVRHKAWRQFTEGVDAIANGKPIIPITNESQESVSPDDELARLRAKHG
jgi:hypothetical protein